jgi:hypothetical protein
MGDYEEDFEVSDTSCLQKYKNSACFHCYSRPSLVRFELNMLGAMFCRKCMRAGEVQSTRADLPHHFTHQNHFMKYCLGNILVWIGLIPVMCKASQKTYELIENFCENVQDYDEDFEDDEDDAQPAGKHHTPASKHQVKQNAVLSRELICIIIFTVSYIVYEP